jgi:hypothetical protein
VVDPQERALVASAIVEHVIRGRAEHVRAPDATEHRETTMLALALDEASAKVRTGPPLDDERDLASPVWAGVLPLTTAPGCPCTLHLGIAAAS